MSLDFSLEAMQPCIVFDRNITHNLGEMANKAGVYNALWRTKESGFETAQEIIPALKEGLDLLLQKPDEFKKYNPENGWGNYDNLVEFVKETLKACKEYPEAKIKTWR